MLCGLVDALLGTLRRAQRLSTERPGGRPSRAKRPLQDWRLQAASTAVVMTEVLFGASPAWRPELERAAGSFEQSTAGNGTQQDELEALVILVEEEWVREPLWGVPTSEECSWHQDDSKRQHLTPQVCIQPRPPLHKRILALPDPAVTSCIDVKLLGTGQAVVCIPP